MAAVVIVGVQPVVEGRDSFGFAGVGLGVGPFLEGSAVEPFGVAVGLWPVGPSPLVDDVITERFGEGAGSEAGAVVGEHPLDGDPCRFDEGVGSFPACGGSLFALVVEELDVGQSGMINDGVVDISHFPYVHPHILAHILGDPERPQVPHYEMYDYAEGVWYRTPREGHVPVGRERPNGFTEYRHAFPFSMFLTNHNEDEQRTAVLGVFYSPTGPKETAAFRVVYRNFQPTADREGEVMGIIRVLDQDRDILEEVRPEEIPVSPRDELHITAPDAASFAFRKWIETVDMLDLAPV